MPTLMFRPHGSSFDPITGDIPERRPSPFRIVRGPPVRSQSPRFGSPNDAAGMESPPRRADTPAAAGPGMRGPSPGRSTGGSRSSSIADVYTSSVMCPLVAATAGAGDGLGARAGGSRPAKARAGLCRAPSPVHGNPGGRGAEEVWLVLLWDRERLWYDRTAHLCPDCSHTARRAYDAPFQVQCRLRREQEAQGIPGTHLRPAFPLLKGWGWGWGRNVLEQLTTIGPPPPWPIACDTGVYASSVSVALWPWTPLLTLSPRPLWEKTKFTREKIWLGHFWYTKFWVPPRSLLIHP